MNKKFAAPIGVALLAVAFVTAVQGAGLRISPLRLDLSSEQPAGQIDLSNLTGAAAAVQVKAYRWTQVNGEDLYEPTKDLFFAPPIVTVPANGQTSVRFRLRTKVPEKVEGTYRVYFQELPPPNQASQAGVGMTYRIRFGVPVFVLPKSPVAAKVKVSASTSDKGIQASISNGGDAHVKIEGVDVFAAGVDRDRPGEPIASQAQNTKGSAYLLAGSSGIWTLDLPGEFPAKGVLLRVRTDDRTGRAGSGILKNGWLWKRLSLGAPEGGAAP